MRGSYITLLHRKNNGYKGDSETQLLISFCKPHKSVSTDTVSCWIKSVMTAAGVDTTCYKSHSTRAAFTSAAARAGVPVDNILSCAGWSNCETFAQFYKKTVIGRY